MDTFTTPSGDPVPSSGVDATFAREAARLLASSLPPADAAAVHLRVEEPNAPAEPIAVPAAAVRLLLSILEGMGKGRAMHVIEYKDEVTTGEMARRSKPSRNPCRPRASRSAACVTGFPGPHLTNRSFNRCTMLM